MKTRHKIAIAKLAYFSTHAVRRLVGKSDVDIFLRDGVMYELDLSQGIDFSIFLINGFEAMTKKALCGLIKDGDVVLDVGANVGAHTLTMAKLVGDRGHVLAFEPTDFAYQKLARNVELNPRLSARISTYQCFLTAPTRQSVPEEIYSSWSLVGGGDVHPKHLGTVETTDRAICRTIDAVVANRAIPKVSLIKMDVDGWECDVLAGAEDVMMHHKPVFVMEIAPYVLNERGASLQQFLAFFERAGYSFYDERTMKPCSMSEVEISTSIRDGESRNVVARVV